MKQALVLCAGEGTRMRPLTDNKSKVMLPVGGKPLLQHTLKKLRNYGVDEFVFVVNYEKQQIMDYFGDGSNYDVDIDYVEQDSPKGTADAIGTAKEEINERFVALNGDLFLKGDIGSLFEKKTRAVVGVKEVSDISRFGEIEEKNGRVFGIQEKPGEERSGLANIGLYVFPPEIFDAIKETALSERGEYEITDSLEILINDYDVEVGCAEIGGEWLDVGRPWDLLTANEQKMKKLNREIKGEVEDGARVKGDVVVEDGAFVKDGAYIEGPCYIDKDAKVGPNCYLRKNTVLGKNVKIGNAVEVKNSIILKDTNIGHLSYVGDSVVGEACNFGAGTKVANLRHDEENVKMNVKGREVDTGKRKLGTIMGNKVKTGINTSINCGTKLSSGETTKPGEEVMEDKPKN
ncbi:glucose-1-phosphate thymidylyltransferase [archaeon SCG-AAA382B04]|nr:glucose-1-phosphate thymidylyltransferase [archaeon SCG-AAA382B04]